MVYEPRFKGLLPRSRCSKAPASSIAGSIRAAKEEGSEGLGVTSAGKMLKSNATRDVDRLFNSFNLGLKVQREKLIFPAQDGNSMLEIPWIKPSSWISYWLDKYPQLLCGTTAIEAELEAFWYCYRAVQPGHAVFRHEPCRLRKTIPVALHGDEGRYLKRSNFMICTIEPILGSHKADLPRCDCAADPVLSRYNDLSSDDSDEDDAPILRVASGQKTNSKGHPFLSKFLCFGLASTYKNYPELLHELFRLVSEDLNELCTAGAAVAQKGYFYTGFLGLKGDMKFHHQIGFLERSYYNLGRVRNLAMCHLCNAGIAEAPFEDLDDQPQWEASLYMNAPWDSNAIPPVAQVEFDPACTPLVFRLDPFHLWRAGTGRDLVGSTIVTLCELQKFDWSPEDTTNIDDRLDRAHSCFRLWALGSRKSPSLRSFTKLNLNRKSRASFPWINCKGSDTSLLTRWLLFFINHQMSKAGDTREQTLLFNAMTQTLSSALVFWDILHSHPLWLHRKCGQRLQHHLSRMIRGYKFCAAQTQTVGFNGFGLKPKLHGLHHLSKDLLIQLRTKARRILNPLCFSCESNEDEVGKVARLSRRVSSRLVNTRVFDRIFFKTRALLRRHFPSQKRKLKRARRARHR